MSAVNFETYEAAAPVFDDVAAEYGQISTMLDSAATGDDAIAAIEQWDALRRQLGNWTTLVNIRFHQDTRNEQYKKDREYCDGLEPKLTNLAVGVKRQLLKSPHREAIEARFGKHAFNLWTCDIAAFDPAIENDLVEQAKVAAEYTELLSSAKFEFLGESLTLSEIVKYAEHPDRDVRHDAARLRWDWFGKNQDQLDALFDKLVRLRQRMAEKLGAENFIRIGYQRMQRTDYDHKDVERFRSQVRELVVPLTVELKRKQAKALDVDPMMAWDEAIHDSAGNPKPDGDCDWMTAQASTMFGELGGGMDTLFDRMVSENLMDLKTREGKSAGGFAEVLPSLGMPFIYANSNGTMKDVTVFAHEMGHAFQMYASLEQPLIDYVLGTMETSEIHSMGLEFLCWPQMQLFFGADADRYRRLHLTQMIEFFPYGVAVDHFQHLVYENPHCSPSDRAAMWQEMERTYQPSLRWGDLAHPASGRRWQAQLHVFGHPFYYIDYALALTCALQLWVRAREDRAAALQTYVKLCHRGGEAPFNELVKSAGLTSPFEAGCLEGVVDYARKELQK